MAPEINSIYEDLKLGKRKKVEVGVDPRTYKGIWLRWPELPVVGPSAAVGVDPAIRDWLIRLMLFNRPRLNGIRPNKLIARDNG